MKQYKIRVLDGWLLASSGILFLAMFAIAKTRPLWFAGLDGYVEALIQPYQTFGATEFFLGVTVFGSATGIFLVAFLVWLFIRTQRRNSRELFVLLATVAVLVFVIKNIVERARPDGLMWLLPIDGFSFPSGHTAGVTAFYGFMIILIARQVENPVLRIVGIVGCTAVIIAVALSRLFLDAHFITDVLGGFLLGIFSLMLVRIIGGGQHALMKK
jgi:undecaprenyl-diphosphatase